MLQENLGVSVCDRKPVVGTFSESNYKTKFLT